MRMRVSWLMTTFAWAALLFGYYTKPFVRPQWNFTAALASATQEAMSPTLRYRLGLEIVNNIPPAGAPLVQSNK